MRSLKLLRIWRCKSEYAALGRDFRRSGICYSSHSLFSTEAEKNMDGQKRRVTTSCSRDALCFSLSHSGLVMNQVSSSAEAADSTNRTLSTLSVTHIPWARLQMFVPPSVCVLVLACILCFLSIHFNETVQLLISSAIQVATYFYPLFVLFIRE